MCTTQLVVDTTTDIIVISDIFPENELFTITFDEMAIIKDRIWDRFSKLSEGASFDRVTKLNNTWFAITTVIGNAWFEQNIPTAQVIQSITDILKEL